MNHIIKKKRIQDGGQQSNGPGAAQIELLKDGDVVRAIEVRCPCGSTTVVELEYPGIQSLGSAVQGSTAPNPQ